MIITATLPVFHRMQGSSNCGVSIKTVNCNTCNQYSFCLLNVHHLLAVVVRLWWKSGF